MSEETFSISQFPTFEEIESRMDERLEPYLQGWMLREIYRNKVVEIPGHTDSKFEPIRYFKVVKKPGESFYSKEQLDNEICLTLWAHWPGYDHECELNLFITGKDVLDGTNKVAAEILKVGGAKMELYWHNILVTNFEKHGFFSTESLDKVWIDDLTEI